jgi:hypothetical protein
VKQLKLIFTKGTRHCQAQLGIPSKEMQHKYLPSQGKSKLIKYAEYTGCLKRKPCCAHSKWLIPQKKMTINPDLAKGSKKFQFQAANRAKSRN